MEKIVIIPESDSYVCCDRILAGIDNGRLHNVSFEGGCDGNGRAIGRLLEGMPVEQAIKLLAGVNCEGKGTSCADQLAAGLQRNLRENLKKEENAR